MKMKKILSALLSASIIAVSLAVPVMADENDAELFDLYDQTAEAELLDYTAADYDIVSVDAADEKVCTDTENIFTTNIDSTKEFYLGFEFNLTEDGLIEVPQLKNSGPDVNKVGPRIKILNSNLVTVTGSNEEKNVQTLGAAAADTWYKGEIEGRTGIGSQYTTFRLYTSDGTLVQETTNFNMRNLSSEGRSFNAMRATNASVRNVKLIQEKPNVIELSAKDDAIDAGNNEAFSYVMKRFDTEMTKYDVTWSVYNEDNTAELEDENIVINQSGILTALIGASTQTVTVRASASFGEKTLYGSKKLTINAVDVSGEKFDTVTVSGSDEIKAGTSQTYTFTAQKNGVDVTDTLASDDIVWSIYNELDIMKNNNINMNIKNGVLTVDESVIPQKITVRASSASGNVYGSTPVEIKWADSQKEIVLAYDACETDRTGTTQTDSWDGSKAYMLTADQTYVIGDQSTYTMMDVDVKFGDVEGHGLTLLNNNGSENSNVRVHSGGLGQQKGGSSWDTILTAEEFDSNAWYHIEFLYLNGAESGYNVYKCNEDGTKTLVKTIPGCNRRNDKPFGKVVFTTGIAIDNLKIVSALPDDITLKASNSSMFPNETNQITAVFTRSGLAINGSGVEWSVRDKDDLPIIDGSITINDVGLLTTSALAQEQIVTVKASAGNTSATVPIEIKSSETFVVNNIGINEDKDKIVKLYVEKVLAYDDDVVFAIAFYDDNDALSKLYTLKGYGSNYKIGDNEITVDWAIPEGFDTTSGNAKIFVWTAF